MNRRRSVQADAVPPAAADGARSETPGPIAAQAHRVTGPEISAAPSVPEPSIEVLDGARLDQQISHLSAQNERLLKSVDTLLHLHESEKAQRRSLQTTLDRLLEEVGISTPARSLETLGTELRNGVSEDLKPLLHAIIELLELSARRGPARPAITPESNGITGARDARDCGAKHDNASAQLPPEDLPGALPEILTKSVEELVGKRRAGRPKALTSKEPNADGNERRAAFKGHRPPAWIPVTSGTLKP